VGKFSINNSPFTASLFKACSRYKTSVKAVAIKTSQHIETAFFLKKSFSASKSFMSIETHMLLHFLVYICGKYCKKCVFFVHKCLIYKFFSQSKYTSLKDMFSRL